MRKRGALKSIVRIFTPFRHKMIYFKNKKECNGYLTQANERKIYGHTYLHIEKRKMK